MKSNKGLISLLVLVAGLGLALVAGTSRAQEPAPGIDAASQGPLGSGFTYQGQLKAGGAPVDGTCDLRFWLYDALAGGAQVGPLNEITGVQVTGGLFTVNLDFGASVFAGDARWLQIAVRCPAASGSYATLGPRQALTAAPYALYALGAPWSGLHGLPAGFADGIDDVAAVVSGTNIYAGEGLSQLAGENSVTLLVDFGGSGTASTVARSDHDHDGRYYTQSQLGTSGAAGVHWGNLTNVPAGLSDGDDDTTYSAGTGLTLAGTQFSVDTVAIQRRVAGTCPGGSAIRVIGADGAVTCESVGGGGGSNTASGECSVVAGGCSSAALADYSFAADHRAIADRRGCFVWGDATETEVRCEGENQFVVRSSGGVYLSTDGDRSSGAHLAPGSSSWSQVSDRDAKENLTSVDVRGVLARLAEIPISTWNYKTQDAAVRHMGPVAQDLYAAFGLGEDERHISAVDADGVALAAIQGLYQVVQEQGAQLDALQGQVDALQARLDRLEGGSGGTASAHLPGYWPLWVGLCLGAAVIWRRREGGE